MSTPQEEDINTTTTKQTLQQDVQSSIAKLLQQRQTNNSDIAIDVYRTIQHESHLLIERQLILDALDNDPFGLMKVVENNDAEQSDVGNEDKEEDSNNTDQKVDNDTEESTANEDNLEIQKNIELITRIKNMLRVISCTRTTTIDGYSSINAVVQFDNDDSMDKNVRNHVRLHFTFLREPQNDNIDTAVDNGKDISDKDVDVEEDKKGCCSSSTKCNATTANSECNGGSSNSTLDEQQQPAKKRKRITKDDESTAEKDVDEDNINDSQSDDDANTNDNSKGGLSPKTIVTYKIDYSIDYGQQHQLLGVDIYALGKYPSVEEAVPMFDDDIDDDDGQLGQQGFDNEEDNMNGSGDEDDSKLTFVKQEENDKKQSTNGEEFEDVVMSDDDGDNIGKECCNNQSCCNEADTTNNDNDIDNENDGGDRFGVHINPENVVSFLDYMNINFNEQSVFYFLLSFPFYEHEWDISGFLLTALFDDEDEVDEEDEEEQMMNGDTMVGCESECPLPCCVPCNA